MKYYSEKLNKPFDTEKECIQAEKEFELEQSEKAKAEEARLNNLSKRKKELSKAIEEADLKVIEANKMYEIAREKARKMLEDSNKQIKEVLSTAESQVRKAEEEKLNAVMQFNKEFGKYTITLTGEKAADEFNRSIQRFHRNIKNLFDFWF